MNVRLRKCPQVAGLLALLAAAPPPQPELHRALAPAPQRDLVSTCAGKQRYDDPAPPVRLFGNTYYVGTCGISAILVAGAEGDVLIDGGPQDAADLTEANLRRLGVRPHDVRVILASHAHYDHVGAIASLKQRLGALFYSTRAARGAVEHGTPPDADPQYDLHQGFPPIAVDRIVHDGQTIRVGTLGIKTVATPGHTPGGTSWTWRSCEQGRCVRVVYADSLSPVSADGYRFSDHPAVVAQLRSSFARLRAISCDILITPHPGASDLFDRLAGKEPLIASDGCARYAAAGEARLEERLRKEQE